MRSLYIRALAVLALFLCRPEAAHACAVCFGRSDSRLAQGMNMGIFTLLGFIICTLAGLSCFFVFLAMRSSRQPHGDVPGTSPEPKSDSPDKPAHS
jgi:hypothetical protein